MPNQYYYPDDEGAQLLLFQNIRPKYAAYATPLTMTPGEVTATGADLDYLIWTWEFWLPTWRAFAESATAFRDTVATGAGGTPAAPPAVPTFGPPADEPTEVNPGALTRLFKSIARWKTAAGYTPEIGQDLQIIGPEMPAGPTAPDLKGKVVGGVPQLTFVKAGHQGLYMEGRSAAAPVFAYLANVITKPFVDTRPLTVPGQPEWREYRAKFWDGQQGLPPGDWSEIVRLTAGE